ncbi:MAG: hypothetical protein AMJ90_09675 [candidate division Zixibacteria bacterium SM23_73_2]|nr:MAG: hypothetical protein AMJ90_09675 [candidate division Zixibacteria bacterium SM23_73_2]
MICWKCKNEVKLDKKPSRSDVCPTCSAYLRCCYNCSFYDSGAHNQCHELQAEWVGDKEKANFCDYFRIRMGSFSKDRKKSKDDVKNKWGDLFKD